MSTLSQLVDERDQALEEIRYLKSVLADLLSPAFDCGCEDGKFTKSERVVLQLLKEREGSIVRKSAFIAALYALRREDGVEVNIDKMIDVWICKVRRKLKHHAIETIRGVGWRLMPLNSETKNA